MGRSPARSTNRQRKPDPHVIVIFGATGDLTARKLMPALYRLGASGYLPKEFAIVGVARRPWDDETLRQKMRSAVETEVGEALDEGVWSWFSNRLYYVRGDAQDEETFGRLAARFADIDGGAGTRLTANRIYYLATLPSLYPDLVEGLGRFERERPGGGWRRIIIEKPFGRDLESAEVLNLLVRRHFSEDQVFRIDHYLGKETVQNILAFRFANGIFEPVWNRNYIDHVQISVTETLGVGHRGAYYEETGALRDMVQNHLLQLLTLVAMEPPATFSADSVRDEKVKVFKSIPLPTPEQIEKSTVRAQYTRGVVGGEAVPGYLEEKDVAPNSQTETYVALRLEIDNWRWAGVPFLLQTGKRLHKRSSQIAIVFKRPPFLPFQRSATPDLKPNCLVLHIQPDQGVTLSLGAKVPGPGMRIRNVDMEFSYERTFEERSPDAYEHLLLEAMEGDPTMFTRGDEVEAAWRLVTHIHEGWQKGLSPLHTYFAGSTGPKAKENLVPKGRAWWGEEEAPAS